MELLDFLTPEDLYPELMAMSIERAQNWGLMMSHISEAQKFTKGAGILVATLDTGTAVHPCLDAAIFGERVNFSDSTSVMDMQGHGTHVAGIIAAREFQDNGVIGVAPEARIMSVKVLNDKAKGNYGWIEQGLQYAIANGADIINMSLGSPSPPPDSLYQQIRAAAEKGIIVVCAAGNDAAAVNYPARYEEVVAVAAVDQNGDIANFSSRDGNVDVTAPGVSIYSTSLNNGYAVLNGTSQAAPFISGVCALLLSHSRSTAGVDPIKNYLDMLVALDKVCDPKGRAGFAGRDGNIGFGIPDFANVNWQGQTPPPQG
ncbi:MAG: S8 family peptidase [Armatimonadetes bacterium]|nr:S8 family peptidase [Armatimonadota bacterium]